MTAFVSAFCEAIAKSPFLKENVPLIGRICYDTVSNGVIKVIKVIKSESMLAIKETTYADEVAIHLIKLTTKVIIRESAAFCTKAILKYFRVERVALEGFKILTEYPYQAGL